MSPIYKIDGVYVNFDLLFSVSEIDSETESDYRSSTRRHNIRYFFILNSQIKVSSKWVEDSRSEKDVLSDSFSKVRDGFISDWQKYKAQNFCGKSDGAGKGE
jgi:hypothetical protein